jgi:argininosuccinate synthase
VPDVDLPVLAPIREIQARRTRPAVRDGGAREARAFGGDSDAKRYTINENVLGVTVSGSEIDELGAPTTRAGS